MVVVLEDQSLRVSSRVGVADVSVLAIVIFCTNGRAQRPIYSNYIMFEFETPNSTPASSPFRGGLGVGGK